MPVEETWGNASNLLDFVSEDGYNMLFYSYANQEYLKCFFRIGK